MADVNQELELAPEVVVTQRRMAQGRIFLGVLILAGMILAVWGGLRGWRAYQSHRYLVECQTAKGQEDWRSLRKAAEAWCAWDPSPHLGWFFAAEAAQNLNDYQAMAKYLAKVPPSDPNYLLSLVEKANLEWTALNQPLEAMKTSEKILELDPEIVEVNSRVVSFYAMNLQRVPMLQSIHRAMQNNSQTREMFVYYIMADLLSFTNGAQMNSRWLVSSPEEKRFKIGLGVHTAMDLAMNVDSARSEKSVQLNEEANRQLDFFLKDAPGDAVILTYLMHRAYQAGETQKVAELLQLVNDDAAEDHMVWVYRAWYHTMNSQFPEAEQAIHEALRIHPASPLSHHEYAALLRKQGKIDAALKEQQLASVGREIRTVLLKTKSADVVDSEALISIAGYLRDCGDQLAFQSLEARLKDFGLTSEKPDAKP